MNNILKGYIYLVGNDGKRKNEEDTFYWSILLT